ncbi:MAG: hypothetical protein ABIH23_11360 [bacterium]
MTGNLRHLALIGTVIALLTATPCFAQFVPADPAGQGLRPLTDAIEINLDVVADSMEGSNNVAITQDGKIVIGWEDDNSGIGAGIRLFNSDLTNIPWANDLEGNNVSSFYYDDGSPTCDISGWAPKVKPNWFGPGFGMGAWAFGFPIADCGPPIASLEAVAEDDEGWENEFPAVQMYEADGTPILPVRCGVTDEVAQPVGTIRMGDFCYLSDGSLAIAGECRQDEANVEMFGLAAPGKAVILGIVKAGQQFPETVTRLTESTASSEMWGGIAPFSNGFAARFALSGQGVNLRYFDNNGNPITGDIALSQFGEGDLAGVLGQGGRGDGEGLASNGNNRVAVVTKVDYDGNLGREVYAATFDDQGNLVAGPINVSADNEYNNADRVKVAVGPDGSFICVWDDDDILLPDRVTLGRIMNPDGSFATEIMALDNRFNIATMDQPGTTQKPKVTWRGNKICVLIESTHSNPGGSSSLAARVFEYGATGVDDWSIY